MDKKAKKRLGVIHKKLQSLQLQLSGARQQDDEPGEVGRLEKEIEDFRAEAVKLRES